MNTIKYVLLYFTILISLLSCSLATYNTRVPAQELKFDYEELPGNRGPWENPGFNYSSCVRKTLNQTTIPFDKFNTFLPECAPEVLYSWQNENMIKFYSDNSSLDNTLPVQRLFLWRTPSNSYGYGVAPLRIKLKKTAKFVLLPFKNRQNEVKKGWDGEEARLRSCANWKVDLNAPKETVFVTMHGDKANDDLNKVHEYILCDDEAIESWSVVSPELLQEIQWETDQVLGRANLDDSALDNYDALLMAVKKPWEYTCDRLNWNQSVFVRNINWIKDKLRENSFTNIYYAKGASHSREEHFSVTRPTYYLRNKKEKSNNYISNIKIKYLDQNGNEIIPTTNKIDIESCIKNQNCYLPFNSNELVQNQNVKKITIAWNCNNSNNYNFIESSIRSVSTLQNIKQDILADQFHVQCIDNQLTQIKEYFPKEGSIKVESSSYGQEGKSVDTTSYTQDFCNEKVVCEYNIAEKYLGIKQPNDKASFNIKFRCLETGKLHDISVPAPASGQVWRFSCFGPSQKIK